jgi:branched-chain amino acid aminotransferase
MDRGLLYGDGFFDTLLWRGGTCAALPYHDARLQQTAEILDIPINIDIFQAERAPFFASLKSDAIVRTTITRGMQNQRGLWPSTPPEPCFYFSAAPWTRDLVGTPVHLMVAEGRRNGHSKFASLKTLNYLENVMAARDAAVQGFDDALMLNTEGHVTGTTIANLWWVEDGQLCTPPLTSGAIAGTVRAKVMDHRAVVEKEISLETLMQHQQWLTSNAVRGFRPVVQKTGNTTDALMLAQELNESFFW